MAEKQKPFPDVVHGSAKILKNPQTAPLAKRMAGRILADQKNDPEPHKPMTPRQRRLYTHPRSNGLLK